jgi:hypothetical protein
MGHSERLTLREIRAIYQLLGEISDLGLEPNAWRKHMLLQLSRLIGARVGLTADLCNLLPGRAPDVIAPLDVGFISERESALYVDYINSTDQKIQDPPMRPMISLHQRTRFYTRDREQLVDNGEWYRSPIVSEARKASGIDHFVISQAQVARPGLVTGFILYRPWGDKPFHSRYRKIVQLFHLELLRRMWPVGRNTPKEYRDLPRHQRLILRGILAGSSAKEISQSLELSTNTVNSYTKTLYTRLGVDSRSQLFTHFLNRAGGRPIFMPAEYEMPDPAPVRQSSNAPKPGRLR